MNKLSNIQHIVLNNKQVTKFDVYKLINNTWIYDYSDYIHGTFKRAKTIAIKHCSSNCVSINLNDWEFKH